MAVQHFARHGYPQTDLDAVAAELGCAKGTLYRYFPSKAELFSEAADFVMRGLTEAVVPLDGMGPIEQVKAGIRGYLAYFEENPAFIELLMQERAEFKDRRTPTFFRYSELMRERWRPVLRGLMEGGRFRRRPLDRVQDVIGNVLYGVIFTNHFAGRRRTLEEQADDVIDVLFHGLLGPEDRGGKTTDE